MEDPLLLKHQLQQQVRSSSWRIGRRPVAMPLRTLAIGSHPGDLLYSRAAGVSTSSGGYRRSARSAIAVSSTGIPW